MDTGIEAVGDEHTADALRRQAGRIGRHARILALCFALAVYLLKRFLP